MNTEGIEAFPLSWPSGWKRTSSHIYRESARFKTSFADARDELFRELDLMRATQIILSTNVPLRRDGIPYSGMRQPEDPGAAVYFTKTTQGKREQLVFACDRWKKVEDNIQAIRLSVNALRGLERWGASDMLSRAFTGFTALPAPSAGPTKREWWDVLCVLRTASDEAVVTARNFLARRYHPDAGTEPSAAKMAEVNAAFQEWERLKK